MVGDLKFITVLTSARCWSDIKSTQSPPFSFKMQFNIIFLCVDTPNVVLYPPFSIIIVAYISLFFACVLFVHEGRDSSVGIATRYGLDGPGFESRWEARFSAPVQTGTGAYPAYCTMGTGSFPGGKAAGDVALTTHPHLAPKLKEE